MAGNSNKYWVFFTDSSNITKHKFIVNRIYFFFIKRFLKKGFRHCFLIQENGELPLILLECLGDHTFVDIVVPGAIEIFKEKYTFALIENVVVKNKMHLDFLSCVGIVKHITGIRGAVFTPWQLYKKINKGEN